MGRFQASFSRMSEEKDLPSPESTLKLPLPYDPNVHISKLWPARLIRAPGESQSRPFKQTFTTTLSTTTICKSDWPWPTTPTNGLPEPPNICEFNDESPEFTERIGIGMFKTGPGVIPEHRAHA